MTPKTNHRGTAALLSAVQELWTSNDMTELAGGAARLAKAAVQSSAELVLLRGEQDRQRGGAAAVPPELEAWAEELLREGSVAGVVTSRGMWAAPMSARAAGYTGVIAVSEPSISEDEARVVLAQLGQVGSAALSQLAARARAEGSMAAARASMAKGLHDLRTPLNSLRLGMHLLAPELATRDQAVVERTQRAIDRMAALVTEMFDSLQKK